MKCIEIQNQVNYSIFKINLIFVLFSFTTLIVTGLLTMTEEVVLLNNV